MDGLQQEKVRSAIIQSAARYLALKRAPLGYTGAMTDYGPARIGPDYNLGEFLDKLIYQPLVDSEGNPLDIEDDFNVSQMDVWLSYTGESEVPSDRIEEVVSAIRMARDEVRSYLAGGYGISIGASV